MASFGSVLLTMFMVFMACQFAMCLANEIDMKISTISASPALLPVAPLSSPALSPDISPLFPTPGAEPLSPSQSSLPTIPSTPSPPNPDDIMAPGPQLYFPLPASSSSSSSSSSLTSSGSLNLVMFLSLLAFCIIRLSGM